MRTFRENDASAANDRRLEAAEKIWLPDMDLNHDKQIQSLLCYRYTIGQTRAYKVEVSPMESRFGKTQERGNVTTARSSARARFTAPGCDRFNVLFSKRFSVL